MRVIDGRHPETRVLAVVALVAGALTVVITWLVYEHVALHAPSAAMPIVLLGLASVGLEAVLALWGMRLLTSLRTDQAHGQFQLFDTAVHDLRQPLQAATLFVDSLLHLQPGASHLKAARALDLSLQAVRHTVDCVMDIVALDAQAVTPNQQPFSLQALLLGLETEFAPRAIASDLRFCLFCPTNDVLVQSDPQLVRQIVRNLLVQALTRTHIGGVLLGVRQSAQRVLIQVWATREDTPAEPGKRPDRGLQVAHRLADLIQAPLAVDAKSRGMFVSTLTLSPAAAARAAEQAKSVM